MLAHLKKTSKLTLCNGLFIQLLGCNANQVKHEYGNSPAPSTSTQNDIRISDNQYSANPQPPLISKTIDGPELVDQWVRDVLNSVFDCYLGLPNGQKDEISRLLSKEGLINENELGYLLTSVRD